MNENTFLSTKYSLIIRQMFVFTDFSSEIYRQKSYYLYEKHCICISSRGGCALSVSPQKSMPNTQKPLVLMVKHSTELRHTHVATLFDE